MIAPAPFKYKCPKCNGEKIIVPKSDVIDYHPFCLKCNSTMIRHELNFANQLNQLSIKEDIYILKNYSDELIKNINSFDIEKVDYLMNTYQELIENLRGKLEN